MVGCVVWNRYVVYGIGLLLGLNLYNVRKPLILYIQILMSSGNLGIRHDVADWT
jgi:hypothetical protein